MSITNSPENRLTSETRTPAQAQVDYIRSQGQDLEYDAELALARAEEVAASVAALADTVAEQEQTLDDWTHLVHARLETHSHRISQSNSMLVKAVTELCDLVDWLAVGTVHMIGVDACSQINKRTAALRALESPAAAPEPSANRCPDCGGDGLAKYTDPNLVKWHHCQTCYGTGLVPAEPPAAVPDAAPTLDPVLVAMQLIFESASDHARRWSGSSGLFIAELEREWARKRPMNIRGEGSIYDDIRAYGRDGAR